MAVEVKLPRLGQGMEAGTVIRWLKSEGDRVEKGEPLYEVDTEKVTQEVEADAGGVLLKIVVAEGEVPVGATLAVVGEPGETVELPSEDGKPKAEEPAPAAVQEAPPEPEREPPPEPEREPPPEPEREPPPAPRADAERIKASPLARRIARERGVDLAALTGTGPDGRIVAEDVERAGAAPAAPRPLAAGEVERIPLTSIRKTIARRLTEAWQVPVFHLQASADMTHATALLEQRRTLDPDLRVTVTDLLTKVCAVALMRHPEVNAQYTDEAILRFPTANVAIAVATDQGLFVPVIRGVERLQLAEIAATRADLVARARAGKLRQEDLEDGTFTISNLGMYRVERFTAVLNPPQAAILAVGAIEDRVVPEGGELAVRAMATLMGTFDHRAVDGAPAAAFMDTVKALLEEPALAL